MRPGISISESSISRRPKAARDYGKGNWVSKQREIEEPGEATYDVCDLELVGGGSHGKSVRLKREILREKRDEVNCGKVSHLFIEIWVKRTLTSRSEVGGGEQEGGERRGRRIYPRENDDSGERRCPLTLRPDSASASPT